MRRLRYIGDEKGKGKKGNEKGMKIALSHGGLQRREYMTATKITSKQFPCEKIPFTSN